MAAPAINNDKYELRIKGRLHGQDVFNVLHFIAHGTPDLIDDLLNAAVTCFTDNLLPVLTHEYTLVGMDVKNVSGVTVQEAFVDITADNAGELLNEGLPSTNAAVVALRSAHPGRTGRGRMFLAGIEEGSSAQSQLDPAFIAGAVAFLVCMFTNFHVGDPPAANFFEWCIASRKDNAYYPIEAYTVRPVIGTMRSRKVS